MSPLIHFLVGLLLAAVLFPFYGWKVLYIFAGGVLIDIDHLFWYFIYFKKFNIVKMYKWCMNVRDVSVFRKLLFVFHTMEFFIIIAVMAFFFEWALMVFIGLLSHYLLDVVYIKRKFRRYMFMNPFCFWIFRKKKGLI